MLYPVELWDPSSRPLAPRSLGQRCGATATPLAKGHKKRGRISAAPFSPGRSQGQFNQLLPERPDVLLPLFLLFFFLSSVLADAPFEQHPLDADLLQEAPLASAEAEAPFEQHPADFDLSQEAPLASVEAEAPADLLQHEPADLDLSHEAFWSFEHAGLLASLAHVCSVLAFFSAGASVDWADTVKAKTANAPKKRNFFMSMWNFASRSAGARKTPLERTRYELLRFVASRKEGFHYFCGPVCRKCANFAGYGEVAEW